MKKWHIDRAVYSIGDFIGWQKDGILVLNPDFQRRAVWSAGAKSYLIDTVVRGFPMPIIFLREQKTNLKDLKTIKEVVDGQQRIRTLISYINPKLLEDYDKEKDDFEIKEIHNKELAGKLFKELDEETQRDILEYKFGVHILPSDVEDRDILQIFARMNASGVKLNNQEIRNALFTGSFKTAAYELAFEQVERWKSWKVFRSADIARMLEVELISEFIIVMITKSIAAKSPKLIDYYYKEYEDKKVPNIKEISKQIRTIMDTIEDLFNTRDPQSILTQKTLFYVLFVLLYDLQFSFGLGHGKGKSVTKQQANLIQEIANKIARGNAPKNVITAYQKNTTNVKSRSALFKYFKEKVK